MNCRNAEQLIPLFVEADLDAAEMQQVSEHLETCNACRHLAAEFQASQLTLHAAALPAFDEATLAAIRIAVQREIVQTASRPSVADWLQPLWNWKVGFATAAVILLVGGIVLSRRDAGIEDIPLAAQAKESVVPAPHSETLQKSPSTAQVFPPRMERKKIARGGVGARERNPENRTTIPLGPERAIEPREQFIAAAETTGSAANFPSLLPENATEPANLKPASPEPEMLRMEFQTADPNIRIIWLTPKEPTRTNNIADTK